MASYIETLNIWSDFHGEGGTQPTASSRINRRVLLAPALPTDAGKQDEEKAKKSVAHP
jgi:hypothetical protein